VKYYTYTLKQGCGESTTLPADTKTLAFTTREARQEWLDAQALAVRLYRVNWHKMSLASLRDVADRIGLAP
jgi:hypothetical protein